MIGDDYKKICKVSFLCLLGGTEKNRFQLSKQTRLERSSSGGIDGSKISSFFRCCSFGSATFTVDLTVKSQIKSEGIIFMREMRLEPAAALQICLFVYFCVTF
jgi:hypothetical protein